MKARLLKKWGSNYAGQVLTNVQEGAIPADVAQLYEDDDPAVNTVVEQTIAGQPLRVVDDELNPQKVELHDKAARDAANRSEAISGIEDGAALEKLERDQTQERARYADEWAAKRVKAAEDKITDEQKRKHAAGKGPRASQLPADTRRD